MEKLIIGSIAGPSGAGKTTLTNGLMAAHDIVVPRHVTTRLSRKDDIEGFYRYINLEQFLKWEERKLFLISSHDTERGYGVLKEDCELAFDKGNTLLINSSYKDISQMKEVDIPIRLIVLTFKDIEKGIHNRIVNADRLHSKSDIDYRVKSALKDHEMYFKEVQLFAKDIIYTDEIGIEETLARAESALGFEHLTRKRVK